MSQPSKETTYLLNPDEAGVKLDTLANPTIVLFI